MEKRTIIAIILSFIIWLAWFKFFMPEQPKPTKEQKQTVVEKTTKDSNKQVKSEKLAPTPKKQLLKLTKKAVAQESINVETKNYSIVLSNQGARVESLKYGKNKIELIAGKEKLKVKSYFDYALHVNEDEFRNGNALDNSNWTVKKVTDKNIVFITETVINNMPVLVEKEFLFHEDKHSFDITYKIHNNNKENFSFPNNYIIFSAADFLGPKMDDYDSYNNQVYNVYYMNEDDEKGTKGVGFFGNITGDEKPLVKRVDGQAKWAGVASRYFVNLIMPVGFDVDGVFFDADESSKGKRIGLYTKVSSIASKTYLEKKLKVCVSPKQKAILEKVDPVLKSATDVNKWIEPLRIIVIWCLNFLYKFIGNYGWAIVIFSILTKLIFLPLTKKSTESMKKMSALSPLMNELKAKYKSKPDVLQKETMKLYKEHGVNPMGGCLPILIQMPFFIALYSALSNSLFMYQAPFGLWITDLSLPDTFATVAGVNLKVLPIIMVITTFLQQKLTTVDTGATGQQQMMMKIMPVIMLYIFWSMPSGLVLYWTIQNVLQIGHQLYTNKAKS